MQMLLRHRKDVPEQEYGDVSASFNDTAASHSAHVRHGTKAELVPRAEDGEPAVTASHTRTQGSKGTIHADPFNRDGFRIGDPPIRFRKQSVTRYVILAPAACRSAATSGSRSQSHHAQLRCRRSPGGRTGRACQEKSTPLGNSWHRDGYLTPCIPDQETGFIGVATRLRDVWEDRLARMEEGSSSLRAFARFSDGICHLGSARAQDTLQRLWLTLGETIEGDRRRERRWRSQRLRL